ncbi:MAG TPA: CdaR family protein [Anaerolineales bacterium]|nr:CdaR family protein [Anaerolineales bacterium]
MSFLRWILTNLSTLILAFALALVVWVSAVTAADPNLDRIRTVPLDVVGLDANMLVVGNIPAQVRATLRAPRSIMERMNTSENAVRAWVDLSGLPAGTHTLEVQVQVNQSFQPVQEILVGPDLVTLTLEPLISRTFPVNLEVTGEPAVGYQRGIPMRTPASVTVSGAASRVSQVDELRAVLDISDANETIQRDIPLLTLDADGETVSEVTVNPQEVRVTQPIALQGGFRNVVVKVVTTGQVANGYRLTNLSVSPPNVVVFSSNPQLVNELPSYVETEQLDLTDAEDDIDSFLALNLPPGISVVGDQNVLVQVSIAAIEGSITLTLPITPVDLLPTFVAVISPQTVDVILSGPVPILNRLRSKDIRVVVDLKDLELGTYQLELRVDLLPERVRLETFLPATVEVTLTIAPTVTPSGTITPTPDATVQP